MSSAFERARSLFAIDRASDRRRSLSLRDISVESLEGRALLSHIHPALHRPADIREDNPIRRDYSGGLAYKTASFYEHYTGPKLDQLNAVGADVYLRKGSFLFTGVNNGPITTAPAYYVFGVNRSGHLPTGPFPDRPDIRFDAVVVVSFTSAGVSGSVVDLANGTTTALSPAEVNIHSGKVQAVVPAGLLPSTGLSPRHYSYNYWTRSGLGSSSQIASFLPEHINDWVGFSKLPQAGRAHFGGSGLPARE